MNEEITLPSQIFSILSIVANIYLLYLYYACPVKAIKSYKNFFVITAFHGLLFSACEILLNPVLVTSEFVLTFAAVGPLRKHFGGQMLIVIFVLAFIASLLIATNSFIYRYIQVCKYRLFEIYESAYGLMVTLLINAAIFALLLATIFKGFWPSFSSAEHLKGAFLIITGLDLSECSRLDFSVELSLLNPISLGLLIVTLTVIFLMAAIIVYFAAQISSTLKRSTLSENMLKVQKRMFVLLVLQIICPLAFLHTPLLIVFGTLFTGYPMSITVTYTVSVLLSIYPLTSPIVIVGFLNEYRNYTMKKLCRLKNKLPIHSNIATVSEIRITPVTNQTNS